MYRTIFCFSWSPADNRKDGTEVTSDDHALLISFRISGESSRFKLTILQRSKDFLYSGSMCYVPLPNIIYIMDVFYSVVVAKSKASKNSPIVLWLEC